MVTNTSFKNELRKFNLYPQIHFTLKNEIKKIEEISFNDNHMNNQNLSSDLNLNKVSDQIDIKNNKSHERNDNLLKKIKSLFC